MSAIILIDDTDTGHGKYGATQVISGSSTVKVDGRSVARQGDRLASHGGHSRVISGGSGSVFIDGLPAARDGDAVSCGGVLIGNSSVNIG
nr:PAAR domain-containing protein [Providencia stuartii]ELR5080660.1 PAAR domain-containing protein [Providencia stuartii]